MSSSRPSESGTLHPEAEHPSGPAAYGLPEPVTEPPGVKWAGDPGMPRRAKGLPDGDNQGSAGAGKSRMPSSGTTDSPLPQWVSHLSPAWQTLRHPSSWTLRSKLVVSMVALFTIITLATGAATTLALHSYLYGQLDQKLSDSLNRPTPIGSDTSCSTDHFGRGPGDEGLVAFATLDGTDVRGCADGPTGGGSRMTLSTAQLSLIFDAGLAHPTNLDLGALGTYRLVAEGGSLTGGGGSVAGTKVVGLPTNDADRTVSQALLIVTLGVIGGLLMVALAGTLIVRRNLRPLDRVAATATRVALLPLDRGQVALAERVPLEDTDVRTEVGQVGAALNEMLDHVDEALQARQESEQRVRQFVADASHELRTPLASIRGYAELTKKEREPIPATVTHALGRVESEAIRMTSLVEDLLLLARLDAGRPLDAEPVDLTEMVVNAVSDAHAASPEHSWQLDLPDEPVEVRGDGARLHQIVANLLANARTHTEPGTVVRTSLSQEGYQARITVHDNGPGVPAELQPHVFERFARGDTSRNRAGGSTGLGLSIVAAVVQAHGGTVQFDSRPGDTTFSVLLPA